MNKAEELQQRLQHTQCHYQALKLLSSGYEMRLIYDDEIVIIQETNKINQNEENISPKNQK